MQKAVSHISFFFDNTRHKADYWRRVEQHRAGWERKYLLITKRVLNREFKKVADVIDVTNYKDTSLPEKILTDAPVRLLLNNLYADVGSYFAKQAYRNIKLQHTDMIFKEDLEDYWREEMLSHIRGKGAEKVQSIAEQNKEIAKSIIKRYLEESLGEGWGAEETARAIRKGLVQEGVELNGWRALRIARTEVMTASNVGQMKGAESSGLPLQKYWIATYDDRTRDTHMEAERQNPKDMNESFTIGRYQMDMPGDERGGPEEVINCRCTIAFEVKGLD